MSETPPDRGAEAELEHTADELDDRLQRLDDHLADTERRARERRADAVPGGDVAGDWQDTKGTPGQGEDPEGAVDDEAGGDAA